MVDTCTYFSDPSSVVIKHKHRQHRQDISHCSFTVQNDTRAPKHVFTHYDAFDNKYAEDGISVIVQSPMTILAFLNHFIHLNSFTTVTTTTSGPWEKYNHNNLMQFMQSKKYNI